jgi:hypothetical protein
VIHRLINSIWKEEQLPQQWKESIIVPIYKKGESFEKMAIEILGDDTNKSE